MAGKWGLDQRCAWLLSCSFAFASRSIFEKASYSHIMSSARISDAHHTSNALRFAAQAVSSSPNWTLGAGLGIYNQAVEGNGSGGHMGAASGATVPPIIDMRRPWGEIEQILLRDASWTVPAFSSPAMVIVRAGEGSPIPVTLPGSSSHAPWSRAQLLQAVHRALNTPLDTPGHRLIDTVGEHAYYGGFSQVDGRTVSLCVVTRNEARRQFSGNL
ncbi:uncharacterized protein SCHCODRAFT_02277860 [Schizophyllum commune H4-8]|uniref:Expressed protein n=1 Tax=Schizophyllum commune (strain H4-8 / FGSC 9210) TaxID=578458 RepID=D8Q617_SCHCM|nr:uncharacterized protein SCHCODRAFT_02277860 [Schizophyllum commune H4-8]KAI5891926.1 hypothetical protein SCHCODRAFT_02277860 [Schizophyllum commune H4-8]